MWRWILVMVQFPTRLKGSLAQIIAFNQLSEGPKVEIRTTCIDPAHSNWYRGQFLGIISVPDKGKCVGLDASELAVLRHIITANFPI